MDLIEKAVMMATLWHMGQKDKGGQTYILHPLAVMSFIQAECTEHPERIPMGLLAQDLLIAGILHDVVEDCGVSLGEIKNLFGSVVMGLVDAVTRREGEKYFDFVRRTKLDEGAVIVKRADLKHNMSPARMANLSEKEKGMIHRYEKAVQILDEVEEKRA